MAPAKLLRARVLSGALRSAGRSGERDAFRLDGSTSSSNLRGIVSSLRAWARTRRDEVIDWPDVSDDLLEVVGVDAGLYGRVSFSLWFGVAHSRLARAVGVEEPRRTHDAGALKRWAKDGDR